MNVVQVTTGYIRVYDLLNTCITIPMNLMRLVDVGIPKADIICAEVILITP